MFILWNQSRMVLTGDWAVKEALGSGDVVQQVQVFSSNRNKFWHSAV